MEETSKKTIDQRISFFTKKSCYAINLKTELLISEGKIRYSVAGREAAISKKSRIRAHLQLISPCSRLSSWAVLTVLIDLLPNKKFQFGIEIQTNIC
jgi:hypothetical protein